jgi:hypothetical protein
MPRRGEHSRQTQRRVGISQHKDARVTVFENLEAGSTIEEIIEQFHVTREQIQSVFEFAARSLDSPTVPTCAPALTDARPR